MSVGLRARTVEVTYFMPTVIARSVAAALGNNLRLRPIRLYTVVPREQTRIKDVRFVHPSQVRDLK